MMLGHLAAWSSTAIVDHFGSLHCVGWWHFFEARPRLRCPRVQPFLTCACMPQALISKAKPKFPSAIPLRGGGNPHVLLDPALWSQQSRQSINTRRPMPQRGRVSEVSHRPRINRPCAWISTNPHSPFTSTTQGQHLAAGSHVELAVVRRDCF